MINKKIRCAIYTRKSCEEGLEQDFNSLDAQREACESYIKSQMHEGWSLIPTHYDDGGFSGGTMERPAFKQLLEDIKQDKIDIVVVYKVDRLTRSIMDFAKIIDIFDGHNASFVSITQHFNTTTSMGRLTLNILLSFAQFEREVTGERIRDKFEATRKKGLWITGIAPYGYTKDEHNILIPEEPYCTNVQIIYEKYLEFGNVDSLQKYLKENNIKSRNNKLFTRGNIYNILSNKVYIGKLQHKDKVYEGQHIGIVSENIFNEVELLLKQNAVIKKHTLHAKEGSLLMGLLYDDAGNKMTPSHSNKHGKRYRYYITKKEYAKNENSKITKIPAGEIENFATEQLCKILKSKHYIQGFLLNETVETQTKILDFLKTFVPDKLFIRNAINQINLQLDNIKITYNLNYIIQYLVAKINDNEIPQNSNDKLLESFDYKVKISLVPKKQNKIIIPGQANYDMNLIQALIKSFWYNKLGAERKLPPEAKNGNNKRLRKLRFLPPDIIESIMNGTQDPELTIKELIQIANECIKN